MSKEQERGATSCRTGRATGASPRRVSEDATYALSGGYERLFDRTYAFSEDCRARLQKGRSRPAARGLTGPGDGDDPCEDDSCGPGFPKMPCRTTNSRPGSGCCPCPPDQLLGRLALEDRIGEGSDPFRAGERCLMFALHSSAAVRCRTGICRVSGGRIGAAAVQERGRCHSKREKPGASRSSKSTDS